MHIIFHSQTLILFLIDFMHTILFGLQELNIEDRMLRHKLLRRSYDLVVFGEPEVFHLWWLAPILGGLFLVVMSIAYFRHARTSETEMLSRALAVLEGRPMTQWSVDDVLRWLKCNHLEQVGCMPDFLTGNVNLLVLYIEPIALSHSINLKNTSVHYFVSFSWLYKNV